jgi:hypothetical protein
MSDESTPVNYGAMYDAGTAPVEPVDIEEVPAADEALVEVPVEDSSVEVPAEDAPVEAPVEETPVEEVTVDDVPDIYGTKFKVDIDDALKLNLRSKAEAGSKIVSILLNNTVLTALSISEDDPEWLFVQVDETSETGYVKKLYVTEA